MSDHNQDVQRLLKNVTELAWTGEAVPGSLAVLNEEFAFPLVTAALAEGEELAVVVASAYDSSRVVAFGHDGFLTSEDMWNFGDNLQLHRNIVDWMSSDDVPPKIGVLNVPTLADRLCDLGYDAQDVGINKCNTCDILYFFPELSDTEVEQLKWYLKGGGAVVTAATGWGWQQIFPDSSLASDFPGNWLLEPFGLVWTEDIPEKTSADGFVVHCPHVDDWPHVDNYPHVDSCQQVDNCSRLLENIKEIAWSGGSIPGSLSIIASCAFPVVVGQSTERSTCFEPVVAASCTNTCKIVAFAHDGFLTNTDMWDFGDNLSFHENIIDWITNDNPEPRIGVINQSNDNLADRIRELDYNVDVIRVAECSQYDIVYCYPNFNDQDLKTMSAYLRKGGGGLVVAATGWGWAQLHPDQKLENDFSGNKLLSPFGIVWTNNYTSKTTDDGYSVREVPQPATNACKAWSAAAGDTSCLSPEEVAQLSHTLVTAIRSAPTVEHFPESTLCEEPPVSSSFLLHVENMVYASEQVNPSEECPITESSITGRLSITCQFKKMQEGTVFDRQVMHPAASNFPGSVSAPVVQKSVYIDTSVSRWHSTGLYAPPGNIVIVTVPDHVIGQDFRVKIGCHTDTLWHLQSWSRFPEICFTYDINLEVTTTANPFGGLVYIDVPNDTTVAPFQAEIDGCVEAAYYKLGETSDWEWKERQRYHTAPFGEIGSDKFILTLPRSVVSTVENPKDLCEFWDSVLDAMAELAGSPSKRSYPERMVFDVQISAGYLHAGYPIMGPLSLAAEAVDVNTLKTKGDWGFFHELGHNHQEDDWTFEGTGEVTVNLFTLYVFDKVIGIPVGEHPRGELEFRKHHMANYNLVEPDFCQWKCDPFLALTMYEQLQQHFGWGVFRAVFAEYRGLPEAERPKTDDEKRDQWLTRFSRHVGQNLEPFFKAWGIPTSSSCSCCLECYPKWFCPDFEHLPSGCCPKRCC